MQTKLVEIRDTATFIPALAIRIDEDGSDATYLLRRAGYRGAGAAVLLVKLTSGEARADPYDWGGDTRTMLTAHDHLVKHWDEVEPGGVVDVGYVMGLRDTPKVSERLTSQDWP